MNFKNYSDLSNDISEEIYKVPAETELIVGIPRSGMVPAYMIAAHLNLPVVSINEFKTGHTGDVGTRKIRVNLNKIKNVLVVDDSVNTGNAMLLAKDDLESFENEYNLKYCAIYSAEERESNVDFYFKHLPRPRAFQWNYKNHILNTEACYDIDGVLCHDPSDEQNDDGPKYKEFLLNAPPLFITTKHISSLVTSRLEKYRPETEAWLKKHGIKYNELIMIDLPTAEERRRLRIHGKFKGETFLNRKEKYFIESNWKQAKEIYRIAKKPVFCTYNDVFIQNESDILMFENAKKYAERWKDNGISENSELRSEFENAKLENSRLNDQVVHLEWKIKELQDNKWYKFGDYSPKYKFLFLLGVFTRKIGLYRILKPFKKKMVKEI